MTDRTLDNFDRFMRIVRELVRQNAERPRADWATLEVEVVNGPRSGVTGKVTIAHPRTRRNWQVSIGRDGSMSEDTWIRGAVTITHGGATLTDEDPAAVARRILEDMK